MKAWAVQIGSGGKELGYINSRLDDFHGNSKPNNFVEYGYNEISDYILISCEIVDYDYKWEFIQETFRAIRESLWMWIEIEEESYINNNQTKDGRFVDLLNSAIENKFNTVLRNSYLTLRK